MSEVVNQEIAAVLSGESRWCVVQADCLDVLRTLPANAVDAVVTDPPYNAINRVTGGLRSLDKGMADSAPIDIPSLTAEFWRVGRESFYVWCADVQFSEWVREFKGFGASARTGVWWKTNPSPMNGESVWLSAVELCVFAKKSGATFNLHCEHPVWRDTWPRAHTMEHPTQKPVELMQRQLLASMPVGGVVLDPFTGSGTTGVAAMNLGYRFIGIEREPKYVEIAKRRISDAAAQGNLFQEVSNV